MPPPVVIVGAGLAGLSCARALGGGYRLFEAEAEVGGLARTDRIDGFSFDWTGHYLHARHPEMRRLIAEELLAGNLLTVERRAVVHSQGVITRYPYQINTSGLPARTVAECLIGFVEATLGEKGRALREREPASFRDFVLRHLGEGFARHFLFPYNEKLYRVPLDELSAQWCGRFVPRPTLAEVVEGALGLGGDGAGYNATFWYPREGGIEALPRALNKSLPIPPETGCRVVEVDVAGRRVRLADGRQVPFRALVWTAPLKDLPDLAPGAPDEVREAARRLRAVSVSSVEIGTKNRSTEQTFHWCYFPEARFPFYRVGCPSAVNPALAPPGCRSLAVEFSHLGPAEPERLRREAVEGLAAAGLLQPDDVLFARVRTIPTAYVLFDLHYGSARSIILDWCRAHRILPAGRYGQWEYSAMEDALLEGRGAAREIARWEER